MYDTDAAKKIAEVSADVGAHDPDEFIIEFNENGDLSFVFDPELVDLCKEGSPEIRRASHVEPSNLFLRIAFHAIRFCVSDDSYLAEFTRRWWVQWRVNMTPVDGPIYGSFKSRVDALKSEREWLYENLGY